MKLHDAPAALAPKWCYVACSPEQRCECREWLAQAVASVVKPGDPRLNTVVGP